MRVRFRSILPLHISLSSFSGQYSVFTAFLEQGDEVIMFEPFFDQYLPSVTFNGGKPVYVPLHPPSHDKANATSGDWTIDLAELRYVCHHSDISVKTARG